MRVQRCICVVQNFVDIVTVKVLILGDLVHLHVHGQYHEACAAKSVLSSVEIRTSSSDRLTSRSVGYVLCCLSFRLYAVSISSVAEWRGAP